MTYIVVSENEIVKAEMERPHYSHYFHGGKAEKYKLSMKRFESHIASLPRIAAPGHKWKLWDEVVEGKDFELKQRKQPSPFCRDCADAEVLGICDYDGFPCNGSAIAIPIQPTQNKIVKEDMICPETGKYCDDECCTVGSICNVSGSTDGISPQPTPEGEKVDIDKIVNTHYDKFFGDGYWEREYKKHIVIFAKQCINLLNNDNTQTK